MYSNPEMYPNSEIRINQIYQSLKDGDCDVMELESFIDELGVEAHEVKDIFGNRLLYSAAEHGQLQIVDLLLQKNFPVDDLSNGETAFFMAARRGHLDICLRLIEANADVYVLGNCDETTLAMASISGNVELCQLLLNFGISPNEKPMDDSGPYYWANIHGHHNVCALLFQHGALLEQNEAIAV